MPSDRFSAEEDEKLIELVSGHPMLWNIANKEWTNQLKKDLAWVEIGRQMEKTSKFSVQNFFCLLHSHLLHTYWDL